MFNVRGGDISAHYLPTKGHYLTALNTSISKLASSFSCPIMITLGNNDFYPNYANNTLFSDLLPELADLYLSLGVIDEGM